MFIISIYYPSLNLWNQTYLVPYCKILYLGLFPEPDVPVISELSKTSTSIKISISCPQRGIADHVKWTICPLAYGACNTQNLSCANASSMEYHARNLKSGSRYRFEAHAVRDVEAKRAESEIVSQILITCKLSRLYSTSY